MIYRTITVRPILLSGVIRAEAKLSENISVETSLVTPVKAYTPDIDLYDGVYEVTPSFEPQKLETMNKVLKDDFMVKEIPVSITANLSGGNTVYIGG